ncbi:hypothetical protein ABNB59_06370 [Paenibacillus larvae]|uniref:Uncharacterized protein n=1 Tax=Paenibacillus larvae TaxID=1464 RepID=A0AAP5N478_9BACL|nr:hypothetical protein [Paenibacillus larvae]AQR77467.1 hypothetical protein BXP28_09000 [Paenibacillus larvae subsp. larvae]AVF21500.1 hypothetical protein ERICI_01622 [Paenibacillus larvae subsp. larvae]ETK30290.1 hypothetical protein ERIC1_1c38570 [Paenibacillus larvae subsp. larvae DSM 25719]MCY7489558.1 hypothetical protein [Paenibacillus larvae]MCY9562389.1 hypothetical protein [Paenibacillus larvae]
MKAKSIVLITGDEYTDVEIRPVQEGILPKEMDAMIALSLGKKTVYINAAMVVSLQLEPELSVL